jgi:hypothetical protein
VNHEEFQRRHPKEPHLLGWLVIEALLRIEQSIRDLKIPILPEDKPHFEWSIGLITTKNQGSKMDITLTNEQQVNVTLKPVSAKGKPVGLDGAPVWALTTGSCTIQPSADGLSCLIVSGDDAGDSEVTVSADADLGAGVVTISDAIRVTVNGAQAQNLGLTADAPTVKP